MNCPKCGSPLRPSKKKEGYFLCDTCRTRMSLEYINQNQPKIKPQIVPQVEVPAESQIDAQPKKTPKTKKRFFFTLSVVIIISLLGFGIYSVLQEAPFFQEETPIEETEYIELNVIEYSTIETDIKPSQGYEFVSINLEINNNSSDSLIIDHIVNFSVYNDDVKLTYSADAIQALLALSMNPLDSVISPNSTVSGYLCIEVPVDWIRLKINYSPNVYDSNPLSVIIEK